MLQGMCSPGQDSQRCSAAPAGLRSGPVLQGSGGRWWAEISSDHHGRQISELQPQVCFGVWIWGAAVHSNVVQKTECYGVSGLCLHLNQCTKQGQTSPQLSDTPEPLGCLHATEPFTLGVLRTSCDPSAHAGGCQSSKPVVPALRTCCKPNIGGWCRV